jgi:hypothetical protein
MSSNAPHSSMRRYVIAAIAAIGCLLPAACDVAAASPGYHGDRPGQGQQGGGRHNSGGTKPTSANSTGANSTGANSTGANSTGANSTGAASTSAATDDQGQGQGNGQGEGQGEDPAGTVAPTVDPSASAAPTVAPPAGDNNGLDVLARDCSKSKLTPHDGFQKAPACVSTAFGEVASAGNDPTLLITDSPRFVRANTAFTLKVSTRNLVRDRFLGAAAGGYYLESSVLTDGGIQRGHFHTACRMLSSLRSAPAPDPVPAFFLATQDNGGGATPDTVTVNVTGLPTRGIAQCAVWAGDGSHRIPMMERANQTPAFDAVRILVG